MKKDGMTMFGRLAWAIFIAALIIAAGFAGHAWADGGGCEPGYELATDLVNLPGDRLGPSEYYERNPDTAEGYAKCRRTVGESNDRSGEVESAVHSDATSRTVVAVEIQHPTPTPSHAHIPTPSPSATPTATPSPSPTPTPTVTPTPTPCGEQRRLSLYVFRTAYSPLLGVHKVKHFTGISNWYTSRVTRDFFGRCSDAGEDNKHGHEPKP